MAETTIKVVINWVDSKATIGVSSPGCDPVLSLATGSIEEVAAQVAPVVIQAREKWQESPLNPKTQRDLTPPKPAPAPSRASSQPKPVPRKKQQEAVQEKFF